jgi:hypothetical protein
VVTVLTAVATSTLVVVVNLATAWKINPFVGHRASQNFRLDVKG